MSEISWLPLESNPDVMNNFIDSLGVEKDWKFVDVWGFEDELLQYIPRPVVALILLFPVDCDDDINKQQQQQSSEDKGDEPKSNVATETVANDPKVYFMRQMIRNACGAIAILHAVANNADVITFKEGSTLKAFIEKTKDLSPEDKANILTASPEINNTHHDCAQTGQTQAPDANSSIDLHFIAFVHVNGVLYEMDGRKPGPVAHGPTTPSTLLEDAGSVCRKFMEKCPNCLRFTAVALVKQE